MNKLWYLFSTLLTTVMFCTVITATAAPVHAASTRDSCTLYVVWDSITATTNTTTNRSGWRANSYVDNHTRSLYSYRGTRAVTRHYRSNGAFVSSRVGTSVSSNVLIRRGDYLRVTITVIKSIYGSRRTGSCRTTTYL